MNVRGRNFAGCLRVSVYPRRSAQALATNMASVSLFWYSNMADVALCETTLYIVFAYYFNDCQIQRLSGKVPSLKLSFGS